MQKKQVVKREVNGRHAKARLIVKRRVTPATHGIAEIKVEEVLPLVPDNSIDDIQTTVDEINQPMPETVTPKQTKKSKKTKKVENNTQNQ